MTVAWINRGLAAAILVFLVLVPPLHVLSEFNLSQVGTRSLWLGIAAASVVFLAAVERTASSRRLASAGE